MQRQIHEYHDLIGYRFIPGLSARVPHEGGGYLVKTNEAGFRCAHEVSRQKPPGVFRILLFGDSFTAGDGVSNQFRYGDLLEKRFQGLQILNFGLSGTGTDQQYLIFREFTEDLEYDLIVICPHVENIRRVVSRYRLVTYREDGKRGYLAKPYFELSGDRLVLRHVPVPKGILEKAELPPGDRKHVDDGGTHLTARRFVHNYLRPFKSIIRRVSRYQPLPSYDRSHHADWLLMKAILTQWVSERDGHPVLVSPIPYYHYTEEIASAKNYLRRFQELAELDGVTIHDVLPRFRAESPEDRRRCRFANDSHLTPYGHEILADALAPAVAKFLGGR
jgi:carbamoyltransferase